jgi:hypothetical protein
MRRFGGSGEHIIDQDNLEHFTSAQIPVLSRRTSGSFRI